MEEPQRRNKKSREDTESIPFCCKECSGNKDPTLVLKEKFIKLRMTCYFCKGMMCEVCFKDTERFCYDCVNKRFIKTEDLKIPEPNFKNDKHVYYRDSSKVETEDGYLVCPCGAMWNEEDYSSCSNTFCDMKMCFQVPKCDYCSKSVCEACQTECEQCNFCDAYCCLENGCGTSSSRMKTCPKCNSSRTCKYCDFDVMFYICTPCTNISHQKSAYK